MFRFCVTEDTKRKCADGGAMALDVFAQKVVKIEMIRRGTELGAVATRCQTQRSNGFENALVQVESGMRRSAPGSVPG